jgi:glyoxylase-like metal-dependent hydrolase (beta-lactamase superfamily II)
VEGVVAGLVAELAPGLRRLTAPNPGMMTGPGTNAYVVGTGEFAVVDPGPDIPGHVEALARLCGDRLRWILCTHTHRDHSPGARRLAQLTGARIAGRPAPDDPRHDDTFAPDRILQDGEVVHAGEATLRAVHTPGHASNHLCFLWEERKLLFTGDHVMQGSTVVISPPDGDMAVYLRSLHKLLDHDLAQLAPGHGRLIDGPHDEVRRLVAHRLKRERKVLDAVRAAPGETLAALVKIAYDDAPEKLHAVAQRSLHAHLLKLKDEGEVREAEGRWRVVSGDS